MSMVIAYIMEELLALMDGVRQLIGLRHQEKETYFCSAARLREERERQERSCKLLAQQVQTAIYKRICTLLVTYLQHHPQWCLGRHIESTLGAQHQKCIKIILTKRGEKEALIGLTFELQ